jgi:hypothetical protein
MKADLDLIGDGLDAIHALGRGNCSRLLEVRGDIAGQGHGAVVGSYYKMARIHLGLPLELLLHVVL